LGAIEVLSEIKDGLTESDADLLGSLARQIAIPLNNAILFDRIKQAEERYRNLFECAGFPMTLIDAETLKIVAMNNVAKTSIGYSEKEIQNMTVMDFEGKEKYEEIRKHIDSIINNGSDTFETKHINKKGEIRNVIVSAVAVKLKDRFYIVNLANDITELKNTQEKLVQSERLAALGKLTATVAHEIRNPLGTVRSSQFSIKDAIERNQPERLVRAFELAERNIIRCDGIINELLEYTKEVELSLENMNIDEWLHDLLENFQFPQGVVPEYSLSSNSLIQFDRVELGKVVKEVLKNAVQAMEEQDPKDNKISVTTSLSGDKLEISITDTGIGIPDEVLENIFEPLFSTKGFGVGLGMPIAKHIMDAHQGGIEVESVEGSETMVTLWLPYKGTA
jgi:PAS domain S-box-containing protein